MEVRMTLLSQAEYRAFLRRDFVAFIERCFYELNPQAKFLMNGHVEVMAAKLEACRQGKIKRLIVNVPPRHLKSLCASIALPAYWLGHDPTAQIICASYGQELSDKLARDCRNIMNSSFYQSTFSTRISAEKQSVQEFVTTSTGFRYATSIGGALTGRGSDVIIIDDPLKPADAVSESQRRSCNEWFDNTLRSRLNDKRNGCIIIIMQRLHQDDLVGHVLEQENWEVIRFPAIAESDEEHLIDTLSGPVIFKRRAGDVLHSEREPRETLDAMRKSIGEYNFAGQYQQAPAPFGGGMVKEDWFKRYGPTELPVGFEEIIQSWDTAIKATDLSDYSVCTTWGIKDNRWFLLNVLRKRMEYPDLKRAVLEQARIYNPTVILIEDKSSGTQLIQELREQGMNAITEYRPESDKVMRLHGQTATIENGFVFLPREAHWLSEYLSELTMFPHAKFDDQVDSTSQALAWKKQRFEWWGLFEYYKRGAEALVRPPTKKVRLLVTDGSSHIITMNGIQIARGADGTIEVSEEDSIPLLRHGYKRVTDVEN